MNNYSIGNQPDYGAFIPSQLDDYPLNPNEFRVLCHISRRAGTEKGHFESIGNTAKHCGMNVKTARNAIKVLKEAGMIAVEERLGATSVIHPTHYEQWVEAEKVPAIRKKITSTKSGKGEEATPTELGNTKFGRGEVPNQVGVPSPNQVPPPLPLEDHKGTPSEGTPSEGNPKKEKSPSGRVDASTPPPTPPPPDPEPRSDPRSEPEPKTEDLGPPSQSRACNRITCSSHTTLSVKLKTDRTRSKVPPPLEPQESQAETSADKSPPKKNKAPKPKTPRRRKTVTDPIHSPETFEQIWQDYALSGWVLAVSGTQAGPKKSAVAEWNKLFEAVDEASRDALSQQIYAGTSLYIAQKTEEAETRQQQTGEYKAFGPCHLSRFLRDRVWQQALNAHEIKQSRESQSHALACSIDWEAWRQAHNRYKPDAWPAIEILTDQDRARISRAVQLVGALPDNPGTPDETLERYILALVWIRVGGEETQWWRNNNHGLGSVLGKTSAPFLLLSSQAKDKGVTPELVMAAGASTDEQIDAVRQACREPDIWDRVAAEERENQREEVFQ